MARAISDDRLREAAWRRAAAGHGRRTAGPFGAYNGHYVLDAAALTAGLVALASLSVLATRGSRDRQRTRKEQT
ncbi:MAG: hypothetical protein ACXVHX_30795 [Solirubrobacteraceae bacterium]